MFELYERGNPFLVLRGETVKFDQEVWRWDGGGLLFFAREEIFDNGT